MYLKLAFRNAKRSITNYLLYITTMIILVAIMTVSNGIAITGKAQGFQTVSLPLLITLILVILAGYINSFMLKERAKEFANYLLLGMERNNLSIKDVPDGIFGDWSDVLCNRNPDRFGYL